MYTCTLDSMLQDGFTRKFAVYFLNLLEAEKKNPLYDPAFVSWAHERGFTAEFASVQGLTEENHRNYLSEYNFYKLWPLNGWSRIWVNDKLTLKYTLSHPDFARFMPKYYYYSTPQDLCPLMDNPNRDSSFDAFAEVLKAVGEMACKPCNGTQAKGFYRLSYENGGFFVDGDPAEEADITAFVKAHPNYVFTEYLRPSREWAVYGPLIHTIRIMVINEHRNDPRIIGNYIRIPYSRQGSANYVMHDGSNDDIYNLYVSIDMETGEYGNALAVYPNGAKRLSVHPDTGAPLSGRIGCFEELKKATLDISNWFGHLEYIGFDFGITTEGLKIMEINTHPAVMVSQIRDPLYLDERSRRYFEKKLRQIDSMTAEEKRLRNEIAR